MTSNATNLSARRAKAIALIQSGVIHSQSDLVSALKKNGYRVTQATASRDLEEIGAVRARGKMVNRSIKLAIHLMMPYLESIPFPQS